ncbi:MAG: hypothetical protein HY690_19860 [Chloroflexi bacterium]|nr:hypothetical protein [Chloroflexota bacterium]
MPDASSLQPRGLKRIVCGYTLGALPAWWLMVHRRLKTSAERQGLQLKVELAPLSALPEAVDLLVVPPELAAAARAQAPRAEVVTIGEDQYPGGVIELAARVADAARYRVERSEGTAPGSPPQPRIVRYVGYERVD